MLCIDRRIGDVFVIFVPGGGEVLIKVDRISEALDGARKVRLAIEADPSIVVKRAELVGGRSLDKARLERRRREAGQS